MFLYNKKILGIDISDRSIEAVELERTGNTVKISSLNRIVLPKDVVENGRIKDEDRLKIIFGNLFNKAGPFPIKTREAIVSLPDELFYLHIFSLKNESEEGRERTVYEEAINVIPIKREDLSYSYKESKSAGSGLIGVAGEEEKTDITLVAADRRNVAEWNVFFSSIGVKARRFDIGPLATRRSFALERDINAYMVVDIGARITKLSVFRRDSLAYYYSFNFGGDFLTQAIVEDSYGFSKKSLSFEEAEKIKVDIGLSHNEEYPSAARVLKSRMSRLAAEIMIAVNFFKEKTGGELKNIIFCGGNGNLPGLKDYFSQSFGQGWDMKAITFVPMLKSHKDAELYAEAAGAGLAGLEKKWKKSDPFIESDDGGEGFDLKIFEEKKEKIKITDWLIGHPIVIRSAIFLFLCIFFLGAFMLGQNNQKTGVAGFFNHTEEKKIKEVTLNLKIPINTREGSVDNNEVKGKIVSRPIKEVQSYEQAKAKSKSEVEAGLKTGEDLWPEAVSASENKKKLVFPLDFKWLVYSHNALVNLSIGEAEKHLIGNSDLSLKSLDWKRIEHSSTTPSVYYLYGDINILTDGDIKF